MARSHRKTATQWASLVSGYDAGTESERDFCHRHDIKLVTLRKWRYHYKSPERKRVVRSPVPFVKVNVSGPRALIEAAMLHIGLDIRLECPALFDVSALAQLALALHLGR